MKAFIVFALFACAYAKPGYVSSYGAFPYTAAVAAPYTTAYSTATYHGTPYAAYPYAAAPYAAAPYVAAPYTAAVAAAPAVVAPAFTKTQYHAQDELGQASYGYAHPGQAHSAVRDAAGNVRGSYAYVNPDGNEIRVNYVADQGGFRVESNALPQAPVHVLPAPVAGPAPVLDTPEVVEARAAHFAAHAEAKLRSARKKRGVVALTHTPASTYSAAFPALTYGAAIAHPAPLAYSAAAYHPAAFGYSTAALHHPTLAYSAAYPAALGYSAAVLPTHAVREATLTKVVNTPGHAVSYRVD